MNKLLSTLLVAGLLTYANPVAAADDNALRYCRSVSVYFGQVIVGRFEYHLQPAQQSKFLTDINKDTIEPVFYRDINNIIAIVYSEDFPDIAKIDDVAAMMSELYQQCIDANTK